MEKGSAFIAGDVQIFIRVTGSLYQCKLANDELKIISSLFMFTIFYNKRSDGRLSGQQRP